MALLLPRSLNAGLSARWLPPTSEPWPHRRLAPAQQPRQNSQEILRMQVLRTADKARHGLFVAGLVEAVSGKSPAATVRGYSKQPRLCRPGL